MKRVNIQFTKEELVNLIDTIWQGIDHRYAEIKNDETSTSRRQVLLRQNKMSHNIYKRLTSLSDSEKLKLDKKELDKSSL